jgi:hypothetical protein
MDKSSLDKIVNIFNEKSVEFKFDYYIFKGIICLRGFFIYNKNESGIKTLLDSSVIKEFRFKKTLSWYLGDRKEILYLQFKNGFETTIPELESYQVNNEV